MLIVKIPSVGESISEVSLLKWRKQNGDYVKRDEVLAELESEKATFELNADQEGVLFHKANEGDTLKIGDVVAEIDETVSGSSVENKIIPLEETTPVIENKVLEVALQTQASPQKEFSPNNELKTTPVATQIIQKEGLDKQQINGSGVGGKITKTDALSALKNNQNTNQNGLKNEREVKREKMSQLRKVISRRIVEAKNTTAMLTTFNEVDMTAIMETRTKYKEAFKKAFDVNLGFMSFFTKACTVALEEFPAVNAYIDGEEILYHHFCDISIAVSAPKGLVVPVIRNAESLSMAEIEKKIIELAGKAKENKLTMEEMTGGTFTITNGGVFGSLMSTPIINLPQSAILGMHKIQERPMAINGQVLVRPMMYLALSYDHRIIDGRESVGFLVRVKELLENPTLLFTRKDPLKHLLNL